jgi:putative transposase
MCKVLNVARSGFYKWLGRSSSSRSEQNKMIINKIIEIRKKQPKKLVYGSPRLQKELTEQGMNYGKNRIARLMRNNNIRSISHRKFKITTNSNHNNQISPDLLKQNFSIKEIDKIYVTDITYVSTREGWLYLAVVLDLCSRRVVGWDTSDRISKELVISAIDKAVSSRKPQEGLIVHSDRGSQYASDDFRKYLENHKFKQSMSGAGNCYDNAVMESFFHSLKIEWIYFEDYQTRSQARNSIFDYIETFYNRERRHSSINYVSPAKFEQNMGRVA